MLQAQYARPHRELPAQGPAVVIAEADGSMLCIVAEGRPRQGKRPRAWQEIRLLAAQREGSVETTYAATFGSVQQAGVRWGHAAKEAGRGMRSRIHTVCDGAEWIAGQTRETFGADATLLIDYFHVSESLAGAAPTCSPAAPERWRQTQQKRLKSGASRQPQLAALCRRAVMRNRFLVSMGAGDFLTPSTSRMKPAMNLRFDELVSGLLGDRCRTTCLSVSGFALPISAHELPIASDVPAKTDRGAGAGARVGKMLAAVGRAKRVRGANKRRRRWLNCTNPFRLFHLCAFPFLHFSGFPPRLSRRWRRSRVHSRSSRRT
jgi:hypothetical protein